MKDFFTRRQLIQLSAFSVSYSLIACSTGELAKDLKMDNNYDVVIIGGGPAGLSAALTLLRGGRSVLVLDSGKPRNTKALHMMNFPSRDGTPPNEFKKAIYQDLSKYSLFRISNEVATSIVRKDNGFEINGNLRTKKILLAHGVRDIMPSINGIKEIWGVSLFFCPYCHGYEYLNEAIGVIASGEMALHYATLLKGLTQDLIIFTNGDVIPDTSVYENRGIKIYDSKIKSLLSENERLQAVELESGETIPRVCLFYRPAQELSVSLGKDMGCELNEFGLYKINENNMTSQEGIYAAGDIVSLKQSVLNACASGSMTAAAINYSVLHD